ncbi:MAG: hypothetical protein M3P38_08825 [Chloroflexota bacterium]|nr:hypothetical protein [Chloroflexota bacterium]
MRWLGLLTIAVALACGTPEPFPGYVRPSEDVRAATVHVVEGYYTARSRAAAARDATDLFSVYPAIAKDEDRSKGINADGFLMERMRISDIVTLDADLEERDPILVLVRGEDAVVLVHGMETWHYRHGAPGRGEFFTRLDLQRGASGWGLQRIDEQLLGEPRPRTPAP